MIELLLDILNWIWIVGIPVGMEALIKFCVYSWLLFAESSFWFSVKGFLHHAVALPRKERSEWNYIARNWISFQWLPFSSMEEQLELGLNLPITANKQKLSEGKVQILFKLSIWTHRFPISREMTIHHSFIWEKMVLGGTALSFWKQNACLEMSFCIGGLTFCRILSGFTH